MKRIQSINSCLSHYKWGNDCDGWNFTNGEDISFKQEKMPAQTAEQLHYHQIAKQHFYILKGTATFLVEDKRFEVKPFETIQINPGEKHQILNQTNQDLEFILFSIPSTQNDRINCEQ